MGGRHSATIKSEGETEVRPTLHVAVGAIRRFFLIFIKSDFETGSFISEYLNDAQKINFTGVLHYNLFLLKISIIYFDLFTS